MESKPCEPPISIEECLTSGGHWIPNDGSDRCDRCHHQVNNPSCQCHDCIADVERSHTQILHPLRTETIDLHQVDALFATITKEHQMAKSYCTRKTHFPSQVLLPLQ